MKNQISSGRVPLEIPSAVNFRIVRDLAQQPPTQTFSCVDPAVGHYGDTTALRIHIGNPFCLLTDRSDGLGKQPGVRP